MSSPTQVILSKLLSLTFLEWCSILCNTNGWAKDRMFNEGFCLRFDCVQGVFKAFSVPVLFNMSMTSASAFMIDTIMMHMTTD
jgi:hypothetical protein